MSATIKIAVATLALVVATNAHAISRYDISTASCRTIQSLVQADGEAILYWAVSPNLPRFDRFVSGQGYCAAGEVAQATFVSSADQAACAVMTCVKPETSPEPESGQTNHVCTRD